MRSRNNTIIATWNIRTLSQLGKLKELTHEMENYNWHILGICETRWKTVEKYQRMNGIGPTIVEKMTGMQMELAS